MRSRTAFLVGAKYLFWVFFLVVYIPIFAAGHARNTFRVSHSDAEHVRARCEAISSCGDNHDAFELAQMTMMRVVAGEIWVSAVAMLLVDAVFLVIATRHIRGRRTSVRLAIRWWKTQLVVVVLSLAIYLALLAAGARGLRRIPEYARLMPYEDAFSSPFTDNAMIYYIAVSTAVSALTLTHNRTLAHLVRPVPTPAPAI